MRKVKNQHLQSANPSLLFARGVESLVADQLHRPSRNDRKDLQKMQREQKQQQPRGTLFATWLRQFSF